MSTQIGLLSMPFSPSGTPLTRLLEPPKLKSRYVSEYDVPVNIDTASVGLPADFFQTFDDGISTVYYAMLGDPLPASIGPVLGMSIGMHIMDLCYTGKDPK